MRTCSRGVERRGCSFRQGCRAELRAAERAENEHRAPAIAEQEERRAAEKAEKEEKETTAGGGKNAKSRGTGRGWLGSQKKEKRGQQKANESGWRFRR